MSTVVQGGDEVTRRSTIVPAIGLSMLICLSMAVVGNGKTGVSTAQAAPKSPRTLEIGSHGQDVKALQTRLRALRHYCGPRIDGAFGQMTRRCVIDFQRVHNLADDGVVGKKTRMVMARSKPIVPSQCKGKTYCILTRTDLQVTYFKSPKISGGVLIVGISSGTEKRYRDRFRISGNRYRVETGFAHTPRGWGTLGPIEIGNKRSRLCSRSGPCMLDPMYISGGPFGYHTFAYHGSSSVPARPASHGCIRVPPELIRWLHAKFPTSVRTTVGVIGPNFAYAKTKAPPGA